MLNIFVIPVTVEPEEQTMDNTRMISKQVCDECGVVLCDSAMRDHKRQVHGQGKMHKCAIKDCGKEYPRK